jgi:hypothetical protein
MNPNESGYRNGPARDAIPSWSGFVPDATQAAPVVNHHPLSRRAVAALDGFSSDHRPVVVHTGHGVTVTYNVGNASDAKVRQDLLRLAAGRPLVIGLQEVADRAGVLASIPGYRLIQLHHRPSSAHVALLVRADAHVHGIRLDSISPRTFVGRNVKGAAHHGGYAEPKYVLSAIINGRRVGVTHFVPSSAFSARARALLRTQVHGAAAFFRDGGDVLMGDFNDRAAARALAPLRHLAHPHSAPSHGRRPIDIVWTRAA